MHKIFIDGQAGTTGLNIHALLAGRNDLELLEIDPGRRKDAAVKQELIAAADIVILCLPDAAARESLALIQASKARPRILDTSSAHRIDSAWVYGLPESAPQQRAAIATARRVSNPGCYPTGFLTGILPLMDAGLIHPAMPLSISALSGYSGGGRQLIEQYQAHARQHPDSLWHVRPYALHLAHKHLPEMQTYARLEVAPLFLPAVGHFYQGMLVLTGLSQQHFTRRVTPEDVQHILAERYAEEPCITVQAVNAEDCLEQGYMDPEATNHTNRLELFVFGHQEQILLLARLDNLGKGASGAAVQNLNLMLDAPELEGLRLEQATQKSTHNNLGNNLENHVDGVHEVLSKHCSGA